MHSLQNPAPSPGTHSAHATNPSLWNFVPFTKVTTFTGRSNWVRSMLEAAQGFTDDDLSSTIQQVFCAMVLNIL